VINAHPVMAETLGAGDDEIRGTIGSMDLGLADRVFVLTGASKGLGFATAQALVADGARVVISARDKSRVDEAVARLGEAQAAGVVADLSDDATPRALVDAARERFGRFDGALISVGGPPRGKSSELTDEQWRTAFDTVFLGTVRAARTFAATLAETGGGAIGLVLSSSARSPIEALGLSNGLRPGLAAVAKELSDSYGHRNVRFVSLLPGRLLTDRNVELFEATGDADRAEADAAATIPLGRLGRPEEFGRVAAFVLSPAASYITGISLPIDGGFLRLP
jgi:3-oxoacyl-[acyl-carrier protein] reductase